MEISVGMNKDNLTHYEAQNRVEAFVPNAGVQINRRLSSRGLAGRFRFCARCLEAKNCLAFLH